MSRQTILFSEDLDRPTPVAQEIARQIAKAFHADIHLFCVEDVSQLHSSGDIKQMVSWHEKHLEQLKQLLEKFPKATEGLLKTGAPAQEILKYSQTKITPEMIIMGTRLHSGLEKLLVGSVAEEVLRNARRPVTLIGPQVKESFFEGFLNSGRGILLATDLRKSSQAAEEYALSLASRLKVGITMFYSVKDQVQAVQESIYMSGMVSFDLEQTYQEIRQTAEKEMQKKANMILKKKVECQILIDQQNLPLGEVLSTEAAKNFDFLVMGARSRNALIRSFVGSAARHAALQAPIPVVVVR